MTDIGTPEISVKPEDLKKNANSLSVKSTSKTPEDQEMEEWIKVMQSQKEPSIQFKGNKSR